MTTTEQPIPTIGELRLRIRDEIVTHWSGRPTKEISSPNVAEYIAGQAIDQVAPVLEAMVRRVNDAERFRFDLERVLDGALGPKVDDGTGQGIAADVALIVRQRDEGRAEVQELRERARHVQEHNDDGYIRHRDELIKALGQHADPTVRTIQQIIERDVAALTEAYNTVEDELIEWRTGQRAVEASAVQWVEIRTTLDETLAAVQKLVGHLTEDAQHEHVEGELSTEDARHD